MRRRRQGRFIDHAPEPVQIAPCAVDAGIGPFEIALGRAVGKHEEARRIRAIAIDDLAGIDDVFLRFAHGFVAPDRDGRAGFDLHGAAVGVFRNLFRIEPFAVFVLVRFVRHHALGEKAGERLIDAEMPRRFHGAGEKARVQQMQNGMLDAADILVDRQPVIRLRTLDRLVGIGRRAITREIPAGIHKRVASVGFAPRRLAACRAGDVFPCRMMVERIAGLIECDIIRQFDGQIFFRNRHDAARVAVDERDRATPITLAADTPVAQAVLAQHLPGLELFDFGDCRFLRLFDIQPVEEL